MIHEIAVDPEALTNWQSFRFLVSHTGVHHGRLISCFPGKWKKKVFEACKNSSDIQDIDKKRIYESLSNINSMLLKTGREYDSSEEWIENAISSDAVTSFKAIISTKDKSGQEEILDLETLDPLDERWHVPRSKPVTRTATELAKAAETLIKGSSEVIFVDQHYSCNKRHGNPLKKFIKYAQSGKSLTRLEYHLVSKARTEFFRNDLDNHRKFLNLDDETRIVFVRWKTTPKSDNIHPRYVLTERGGLQYDYGLDEAASEGETTDVSCMDQSHHAERWKRFNPDSGDLDLIDAWIVTASDISEAKWEEGNFVKA
ncbi:hypothetical protein OAG99_01800 [Akkermansiaceae bacterium]|nr:hypothetical protein [Akkermansiaceae bacterium]